MTAPDLAFGEEEMEEACQRAFNEMAWPKPQNSIQEINSAGKVLVKPLDTDDPEDFEEWLVVFTILNDWRAAHRFPLNTFAVNLRRAARGFDKNAIVAQRIKRLSSVRGKLDTSGNPLAAGRGA